MKRLTTTLKGLSSFSPKTQGVLFMLAPAMYVLGTASIARYSTFSLERLVKELFDPASTEKLRLVLRNEK